MASIHPHKERFNSEHVGQIKDELLQEGKNLAEDIRDAGIRKAKNSKKELDAYSHQLIELIRQKPLESMLIAGGIGLLLSTLMKK